MTNWKRKKKKREKEFTKQRSCDFTFAKYDSWTVRFYASGHGQWSMKKMAAPYLAGQTIEDIPVSGFAPQPGQEPFFQRKNSILREKCIPPMERLIECRFSMWHVSDVIGDKSQGTNAVDKATAGSPVWPTFLFICLVLFSRIREKWKCASGSPFM